MQHVQIKVTFCNVELVYWNKESPTQLLYLQPYKLIWNYLKVKYTIKSWEKNNHAAMAVVKHMTVCLACYIASGTISVKENFKETQIPSYKELIKYSRVKCVIKLIISVQLVCDWIVSMISHRPCTLKVNHKIDFNPPPQVMAENLWKYIWTTTNPKVWRHSKPFPNSLRKVMWKSVASYWTTCKTFENLWKYIWATTNPKVWRHLKPFQNR